jgi:hypothetical protein
MVEIPSRRCKFLADRSDGHQRETIVILMVYGDQPFKRDARATGGAGRGSWRAAHSSAG